MIFKKRYYFILILMTSFTYAEDRIFNEFVTSVGFVQVDFAENKKTIVGENVSQTFSGSTTAISALLQHKISKKQNHSVFLNATVPVVSQGTGVYYSADIALEYYLSDLASKMSYTNKEVELVYFPSFRYFVGAETGFGYLVYNSETTTKNDIMFNVGGNAGASYAFTEDIIVKSSLSLIKNTGILTNGFTVKVFLGANFYY